MLPLSLNIAIFSAVFLTTVFPILLLLILLLRKKINLFPLAMGMLIFFVSGILLRDSLLYVLSVRWPIVLSVLPAWFLFAALVSAALVESGRVLVRKKFSAYSSFKDALSFGLGVGLAEVLLTVGLGLYANALVAMSAAGFVELPASIDAARLGDLISQLSSIGLLSYLSKIVECLALVLFHIFASLLIFAGVNREQTNKYWLLTVAAHLLFSYVRFMLAAYVNVWLVLLAWLGLAWLLSRLVLESRAGFPEAEREELAANPESM